ncbi:MAG TPA: TIGR04086 family membrane protein [Clostridiales bacterium]|nr:TIGR04086 family membrane protein [Clostridiales bacterium]
MGKQKRAGATGTIKALLLGILFSLAMFACLALIAGAVLYATEDPTSSLPMVSLEVFGLSGLFAGFFLAARRKEGGTLLSILTALAFALLLLLVGILMTGGHLSGRVMMNHLCYLLTASLGAILANMHKSAPKRKRHHRVP